MKNMFQIICTLVKAQIDKAKQSGGNGKEINDISKDTLVNLLNISDEMYNAAQSAVQQVEKDEISSSSSTTNWLSPGYNPSTYFKTPGPVKEVFLINQGRTRGTTFKIDTGGYVFSCLFDTGAKVSCMNVETCTALGLLHSISDTNIQVNTASGQDMGIVGPCYGHI